MSAWRIHPSKLLAIGMLGTEENKEGGRVVLELQA